MLFHQPLSLNKTIGQMKANMKLQRPCAGLKLRLKDPSNDKETCRGKSLSEALLFAEHVKHVVYKNCSECQK